MKTEQTKPTLLDLGYRPGDADAIAKILADRMPDFVIACSITTWKSPRNAKLMRSLVSKDFFAKKRERRERRHQKSNS